MAEEPKGMNRYLMVELSCDETQCQPCTYPNCQRFVREHKKMKNPALGVKAVSKRVFDVRVPIIKERGELEIAHYDEKPIDRYVLVELSCSNVQCAPCTYPNCQRFVREKREKAVVKGIKLVTTELKDDHVSEILADERAEGGKEKTDEIRSPGKEKKRISKK